MVQCKNKIEYLVMKYLAVTKSPVAEAGKKHIACIGDSITFGAGVRGQKNKTWEYTLNQCLGDAWQVLNYGISGRTLLSTGDYPYTDEKHFRLSKESLSDVYLIMLGTNDSKPYNWNEAQYAGELETFVSGYLQLSNKPAVVLMCPTACFEEPKPGAAGFNISGTLVANEIRNIVRDLAKEKGLPCIDLYACTKDHGEWFVDGVHPNEQGNAEIGDYIYRELLRNGVVPGE